jgi:aspartate aminotransferase-like enzyme
MIGVDDITPVSAAEYAEIERKFAELVGTRRDCFIVQGEAILALEAVARGLGGPDVRALNVVSGPYGAVFGDWLRQTGAEVEDLAVDFDRAVSADLVRDALARAGAVDLVSIVHAEAATGAVNPLREIAAVVREAGAILAVDAVASIGADPLALDEWGVDVAVLAAQKALAGPTGAAAVVVDERVWQRLRVNPAAPRRSILSLLDWKERWLDSGREGLPVIPHHVETRLLGSALDRALAESLAAIVERHARARDACRAGLRALGLEPWVQDDREATAVVTTVRPPDGISSASLLRASHDAQRDAAPPALSLAPGTLAPFALRIDHTGRRANVATVLAALASLGLGLRRLGVEVDVGEALGAAIAARSADGGANREVEPNSAS